MITALLLSLALAQPAEARDRNVVREFQRVTICPATGHAGRCPGYIVDHVIPLCAGGPDAITNMQYQTIEAARLKDRAEARQCAALRRQR